MLVETSGHSHALNVRLIGENRRKDDRLDAQTLARLGRIDPQLLCPVKHRSTQAQADLTVIRARAGLVRARTALVNTARDWLNATERSPRPHIPVSTNALRGFLLHPRSIHSAPPRTSG